MEDVNKTTFRHIELVLMLFISIKGRINFSQLSRYSEKGEQYFRNNFSKKFNFLEFNKILILQQGCEDLTIAFDPSYISKSGKKTFGLGYFWSGCASSSKWGLEIGGFAAIDNKNKTALHLDAIQTNNKSESETLLDFYANILVERKNDFLEISKYIVADAYFSKNSYVSKLQDNGFHIVSRLRKDADLKYIYYGEQKEGRGRPKKHDGKIDFKNLDLSKFNIIEDNEQTKIYHTVVSSKSLKRHINLVIVCSFIKTKWTSKLYFSTDLDLEPDTILRYYRSRFQIEFLYRDGKQHTGLNDCQAISENKLSTHFNLALTAINLSKISHWLCVPEDERKAFSMSSVKTVYSNHLLLKRFILMFGINPNSYKNKERICELNTYGSIAA